MASMFRRMLAMLLVICMVVPYMMTGASAADSTSAGVEAVEPTTSAAVAVVPSVGAEETTGAVEEPEATEGEDLPNITGISMDTISIYEQTGGELWTETDEQTGTESSYYHYDWHWESFTWTVYFENGTSETLDEIITGQFEYDGCWYQLEFSDEQSLENPWVAGGSYTATMCLHNVTDDSYYYADTTVNILASPLNSISQYKITLGEGVDLENMEYEEDGELKTWKRYNWERHLNGTLIFTDGTKVELSGPTFTYEGKEYEIAATDDQSPDNQWTKGSSTQVSISVMGKTRSFRVDIDENPVSSVTLSGITIPLKTEGHWEYEEVDGKEVSYWRYDWHNLLEYEIDFSDSSTAGTGGSFQYNGFDYDFVLYDEQSAENPWEPGQVYTVGVEIFGNVYNTEVMIEESPIADVQIAPVSIYEGSDGRVAEREDGSSYYHYHWWHKLQWIVTFTDGTTMEGNGTGFDYSGQWYDFWIADEDQSNDPWQVNNTYTTSVTLAEITVPATVTVMESPVQSVTVAPVPLYEYQDCGQEMGWSELQQGEVEYTRYHWDNHAYITVTFKDGTSWDGEGSQFLYQDYWYDFEFTDDQGPDTPWQVGGSYTGTVKALGAEATTTVTLNASPVAKLELSPFNVYKTLNSDTIEYPVWDDEGNEYFKEFELYYWWDQIPYTVYFNDGTDPVSGKGSGFSYNGRYYPFSYEDTQSDQEQWQIGDVRTVTVAAMGVSAETTVTVVESAVNSVSVDPVSIMENTCGYLWNEGTDAEYYHYNWVDQLRFTLWFADGSSFSGSGNYFEFQNGGHGFEINDSQSDETPWTAGGPYIVTASALGYEFNVSVSIEKSPIESISFAPVSLVENSGGELISEYDPETGELLWEYYYYWWWNQLAYTVTFSDGTAPISGTGSGFSYNGQYYGFSITNTQSPTNPWTAGNTYTCQVSVAGCTATAEFTIIESPLASITMAPVSYVENSGGWTSQRWDEATESYVDYYYYWWTDKCYVTLTFTDGQVRTVRPWESFEYNGQTYNLESYYEIDSQYNAPWQAGGSYTVEVSFMGMTAQTQVTIERLPVQSIQFETVSLKENTNGYWSSSCIDGVEYNYFYYYWRDYIRYTVTYEDGNTQSGNGAGFYYNDTWISFGIIDPQNPQAPFLAGNTYEIPVTVGSITENIYVSIYTSYEENGWEYMIQDDCAFITQCHNYVSLLEVPDTLGGYPVTGIIGMSNVEYSATEVVIADSVTMLSTSVFSGWGWRNNLRKVTIGAGITDLTMDMFIECDALEAIEVSAANTSYCSEDGVVFDLAMTTVVVFPLGKTGNYTIPTSVVNADAIMNNLSRLKATIDFNEIEGYKKLDDAIFNEDFTVLYTVDSDKTGSYQIPSTVTTINRMAFANSQLAEVIIPEGVTEIAYYTFYGCQQLQKVIIPESVTAIGECAFAYCTSLAEADLPSNLQSMDGKAFQGSGVENVVIPGTLKIVPWAAFNDCGNLTSLILSEGVQEIEASAFSNTRIQSLQIPESLISIGGSAFANTYIQSLVIPDTLTNLGYSAFANCQQLSQLTIGKGLVTIPGSAFHHTALTEVVFPENIEYIGGSSFAYCTQLKDVTFMNSAVSLGDRAFAWSGLEAIELGDQLTSIEWEIFRGTQLTEITIPESVTAITYKSFADCEQLMDIDIPATLTELWTNSFENTAWYNSQPDGPVFLEHFFYNYKGEISKGTILNIPANITHLTYGSFGEFSAVIFQGDAPTNVQLSDTMVIYPAGNQSWEDLISSGSYSNVTFAAALHSGTCGDSLGWVLDENGVLRIFGFGRMYDYTFGTSATRSATSVAPWYAYGGSVIAIEIGPEVEYIGTFAFADCAAATVSFTGEAPEIGAAAFYNVTATATYPTGYDSWTESATGNYGGTITWDAMDTEVASGTCGENLTWVLDESGTLTISGEGEMYGYGWGGAPWYEQREQIKRVYVSDGVTTIGGGAFYYCCELTYARLPDSLERIDNGGAFSACWKLESIDLPENLQSIGSEAFQSTGLKEIVIPDSVTSMGGFVFAGCYSLTSATIGSGLDMLESYTFDWCENLESVTISEGVRFITRYVFRGCSKLTQLQLPETVTSISYNVFQYSGLQEITVPQSVTEIGYGAFKWAHSLNKVTFTGNAPSIDDSAFWNVSADVYFPGNDASWDGVAYNGYSGNLRWHPVVSYLAEGACGDDLQWHLTENGILEFTGGGLMYDYEPGAAPWYPYMYLIHTVNLNDVSVVGEYAFYGCYQLENVNSWGNVVAYNAYSFYGCDQLRNFATSDPLSVIGEYAFAGCSSLETFPFVSNLCNIGAHAFEGCYSLYSAVLQDNVTLVGEYAFSGCSSLQYAKLSSAMSQISNGLFSGCMKLMYVEIYEGITYIGAEAFMNCKNLTSIALPDTVDYIGDFAFFGCNSLRDLQIPENVRYVGSYAMHNCTNLQQIIFAGDMPQFGYQPLSNVTGTVSYPANAEGWSEDALAGLGGSFDTAPYVKSTAAVYGMDAYIDGYETLQQAIDSCDPESQYVMLLEDQDAELTLNADLYLDLNGYALTGTVITNGYTIYGMDSQTDGYSSYDMGSFSCVDENGQEVVPEKLVYVTDPIREQPFRYMAIRDEQGWSFHRFYLGITHTSLSIQTVGLGFKATFCGDDMVAQQLDSYGYKLQLENCRAVERWKQIDSFTSGQTLTLRINNWDVENRGETTLYAQVALKLKDGTVIESYRNDTSMRRVVEKVNEQVGSYSASVQQALQSLIENYPAMKDWAVEDIVNAGPQVVHPGNFAFDYQYVMYQIVSYDGVETLNKTTVTPGSGIVREGLTQTPQYDGQPATEYNGHSWYGATGYGDELSFSLTDEYVVFSVNEGEGYIYCEVLSDGTVRVVEADLYFSAGDILTPVYN